MKNSDKIEDAMQHLVNDAKRNIIRGVKSLLFIIFRIFLETWIVMAIWNNIAVSHTGSVAFTYWETFYVMLMFRIMMGHIKIGNISTTNTVKNKQDEK